MEQKGYSIHKIMGTEFKKHLGFTKRTDGMFDIWNKKTEFLGVIFYYKSWKEWCYLLAEGVIISLECSKELSEFMSNIKIEEDDLSFEEYQKSTIPECTTPAWELLQTLKKEAIPPNPKGQVPTNASHSEGIGYP